MVTGPAESLLRVGAKTLRGGPSERRPVLIIGGPTDEHRFAALQAPEDRGRVLRAAYVVPTSLVQPGAPCWLELSDGTRTQLPPPEQGAARVRAAGRDSPTRAEPLQRRVVELEQALGVREARIESLELELADSAPDHPAHEGLENEVAKLRTRQSSLERELDHARDELRIMTFERDELSRQAAAFDGVAVKARERAALAEAANEKSAATLSELQTWRGELERRLAETTSELGAARAAREADERELARLRASLAEGPRGGADPLPSANGGDHTATVTAQAQEIERLAAELASLRARLAREA